MRTNFLVIVAAALLAGIGPQGVAPEGPPARKPENLQLELVTMAYTHPPQYIFVVNHVLGFKGVDELKRYIADLPAGSTLTWGPGCCRQGGEPLLHDEKTLAAFKKYCEEKKVKLVIIPGG